jgi:hypothetical protein
MNIQTRLFCGAFASLLVPTILWASVSATDAINRHLSYVSCLESLDLDGIASPSKVCHDREH